MCSTQRKAVKIFAEQIESLSEVDEIEAELHQKCREIPYAENILEIRGIVLKKMQSLILIACKLLRIIFTILRTGCRYEPMKMLRDRAAAQAA